LFYISNTTISFLDTSSSLSEGVLSTDLYSKPTDTNQYLLPSSCHPPHVTKSIAYSQALRISRICSTDKSLKKRLCQLKNNLKRRGYKLNIIKKSFSKANNISRSSLLQYKGKQKCKRTPCVLTYHPCLRNSFNTIRGHWTSVKKKIQTVQSLSWASHGCLQTTKQSEKPVGAGRDVKA
jgi:peptide-methionine (R)-S-oxide reductase